MLIPLFGSYEIGEIARYNLEKYGRSGLWSESRAAHRDRKGVLQWFMSWRHNIWHDDGEEWVVKALFDRNEGVSPFNTLYLGLDNRALGAYLETHNLGNLSGENVGVNNYSRQDVDTGTVTNDWTSSIVGGIWQAQCASQPFLATGGPWTQVQTVFLTDKDTAVTGKYLIASTPLSAPRTLQDGDTLNVDITIKVQEPTGQ